MTQPGFRQRFRYRFDNFMSKGPKSIFLSLLAAFVGLYALMIGLRLVVYLLAPEGVDAGDDFWSHMFVVFLEMTDPGNMGQDAKTSVVYKVTAILAGLCGVILLSMLIAFITTSLDERLRQLRKGRSTVIETGHTLILGWNDRVPEILRELVIANESEPDACVVILADREKEAMDDELSIRLVERKNTRVVTRSGNPSLPNNLALASMATSKSAIVLAHCPDSAGADEKAASDARVIKTILALMASRPEGVKLNIVAEIFSDRNRQIVREISADEIHTIDTRDILAKMLVQTSRSIGLSVVYNEVLSFDGCELYFYAADWKDIEFGPLQFHFPDGVPIGIRRQNGQLLINPAGDTRVQTGDDILILADDNSTIDFRPAPVARPQELPLHGRRQKRGVERELILGWSTKAQRIIEEYDNYVEPGSSILVMHPHPDADMRREIAGLQESLKNLTVQLVEKDPMDVDALLDARPFNRDNILILGLRADDADAERTDSETIMLLLLLRRTLKQHSSIGGNTKLVTEVLVSDNHSLVARAGVNDIIISNRFISMMLAQISEQGGMQAVYDDLFQEYGSEIYLKPAALYLKDFPAELRFADLMRLAQQRNEVCIGVKIKAHEADEHRNYGVKLIPEKSAVYRLEPDDCLVVVAEDES